MNWQILDVCLEKHKIMHFQSLSLREQTVSIKLTGGKGTPKGRLAIIHGTKYAENSP